MVAQVYIFLGTTTTLKIYNKYLEFKQHDLKRFKNNNDFDLLNYLNIIQGFLRFEVEIKKKKLESLFNNKYIRIRNLNYNELRRIWSDEFMKLLKFYDCELKIVRDRFKVRERLYLLYSERKAKNLYSFYCSLIVDGVDLVKNQINYYSFYRNIKFLKEAGIDFSQKLDITSYNKFIDFNPFTFKEVV